MWIYPLLCVLVVFFLQDKDMVATAVGGRYYSRSDLLLSRGKYAVSEQTKNLLVQCGIWHTRGCKAGRNRAKNIPTIINNRPILLDERQTFLKTQARHRYLADVNSIKEDDHPLAAVGKQTESHRMPNILVCNARSICNKKHELEATLSTYSAQIACITESWANADVPDDVLSMPGFQLFRKDRLGQKGGGLVAYISDTIPARRLQDLEDKDLEVVWIEVRPRRLPRSVPVIVLGIVYHPPCRNNKVGNDQMLYHLVNTIDAIHRRQPQAGILLCGDVNRLPLRRIHAAHPTLKQIVKQPTRGSAILDVVITNLAQFYGEPQIIAPIGRSDHACVVLQAQTQVEKQAPGKLSRRMVSHSNKADFALSIATADWSRVLDAASVEEKVSEFYSTIMHLVEHHFPMKVRSVRADDKSWMTERVKRAIKQRQEEFQRHGKSPLWKQLRNKVKTVVQQAKNFHYRNCIQQLKQENPRKWWSCINRELGRSQKSGRSALDGIPAGQAAETISQHFSEAWCQSVPLYMFPLPLGDPGPDLCSIGEVKCLLKSVKPKKACGPDSLPNWILTEFAEDLAPIVTHLFNASYAEGTVPVGWKSANVVPVPKFAGACQARDMRPVSLLSVLAKLLERCILKRLLPSIQSVIKNQYAYVKGSSTTLALVRMVQTWLTAVDANKPTLVRAIFADMSKAFDRVDHALLLQRVIDIHVSPRMQRWIFSFLQNRRQRVVMDRESSSWRTLTKSAPIPPMITLGGQPVPSVDCAKGLGFYMDKNLTFDEQISAMISKASRRLYYLRLLTKQGTSITDLIQIYLSLVRPVLEYGHVILVGCSKEQELAIERVQRRALRIISLGGRRSVPDLPTLKVRREEAAVQLFERMLKEDHPLHDMVPPTRTGATGRTLRNSRTISLPKARTKRLSKSFLHSAIRLYNKKVTQ
ncbi:uncharacterized protein LOC118410520 [Branchiostoma floridae]|uniref:Uncharacterized protein LOC118410520 n=1 Tax=Branchiostoma floridae TaxID=7739 RepID=A0A9J7KQC1_BRAFL|nr:uncharacterized protein LOC118410520 [Branchiostoma floridae]